MNRIIFRLLCVWACLLPQLSFAQKGYKNALALRNNVLKVRASLSGNEQFGFGFVIGEREDKLFVVTAAHTLSFPSQDREWVTPDIYLEFYSAFGEQKARVIHIIDDRDIAILTIPKPNEYTWKSHCMGNARKGETDLRFIGRPGSGDQWYVSPVTKHKGILNITPDGIIHFDVEGLVPGCSGAPLLDDEGIVGMIIQDEQESAKAVNIKVIWDKIQELEFPENPFQLKHTKFVDLKAKGKLKLKLRENDLAQKLDQNLIKIIVSEEKTAIGFITGEKNGYLYAVAPLEPMIELLPEDGHASSILIEVQLTGTLSERNAFIEYTDLLQGLVRIKVKKPKHFNWEKSALPVQWSNQDLVIALDGNSFPQAGDQSTAAIAYHHSRDIVLLASEEFQATPGAMVLAEEGMIGMLMMSEGQDLIVRRMEIIEAFMTKSGKFPSAYQLLNSELAIKRHHLFELDPKARVFLNFRAGSTESDQDLAESLANISETNSLDFTTEMILGLRKPNGFFLGMQGTYFWGSRGQYINTEVGAISAQLYGGHEFSLWRFQIAPAVSLGGLYVDGGITTVCQGQAWCRETYRDVSGLGLAYGVYLQTFISLSQSLRLGGEIGYRRFTHHFVKQGVSVVGTLDISIPRTSD